LEFEIWKLVIVIVIVIIIVIGIGNCYYILFSRGSVQNLYLLLLNDSSVKHEQKGQSEQN
jgi:hypothetical protein